MTLEFGTNEFTQRMGVKIASLQHLFYKTLFALQLHKLQRCM